MEMLFVIPFFLCIPLVLFVILRPIAAEQKELGGVRNFDADRKRYLFALPVGASEAEQWLKTENVLDEPRTRYENGQLILTHMRVEMRFAVSFLTDGTQTFLWLTRLTMSKGNIPFLLTPLFRQKLGAEPADIRLLDTLKPCPPER